MKKEDVSGLVVYMLIIAIAVVYSLTVLQTHFVNSTFQTIGSYALYILVSILLGVVSSSILYELGHLLGSAIGKYSVIFFSILHFTLYKDENKWKFGFKNYDGLTGQTKIVPKSAKSKPTPYLLSGIITIAIWIFVCFVMFNIFNGKSNWFSDVAYLFLTMGVIAIIVLLYNIIPVKLDVNTDGYYLKLVAKQEGKDNFNRMLALGHNVDLGETNEEVKVAKEVDNITAELSIEHVQQLLDKEAYDEADEVIGKILDSSDKISSKVELKCMSIRLFIKAIKSTDDAISYGKDSFSIQTRKDLYDDDSMHAIRAYLILEGLVDNSKSECALIIKKVAKAYKAVAKERKESEKLMYNKIIDVICEAHPKWEFEAYKIA